MKDLTEASTDEKLAEAGDAAITVSDATGRRRFFKTGTALLLSGGAALASRSALASDCDRAVGGGEPDGKTPKQAESGSDSDAGANADPAGCGRRRHDTPKISRGDGPDGSSGPVARLARVVDTRSS